jgi:hypothetical protein
VLYAAMTEMAMIAALTQAADLDVKGTTERV